MAFGICGVRMAGSCRLAEGDACHSINTTFIRQNVSVFVKHSQKDELFPAAWLRPEAFVTTSRRC